jgi:hypothetical protein
MKTIFVVAIAAVVVINSLAAQNPDGLKINPSRVSPLIPVEVFVGNRGLVFQMIVSKQFSSESTLGFLNVTSFVGDYAATNQKNQYLSRSFLTANLWKGLSANAGISLSSAMGFRPFAGIQYIFADKHVSALVLPRFDLTQAYNFEILGLVECKPAFTEDWGLYSRVQAVYNHNTKCNFHERSYLWLRLGASYKNFQFGVGINADFYGRNTVYVNFPQSVLSL